MEKADKTYYDRKIAYLDYFERGEKIKNGGFVRWEVKDNNCRIQIHIRGLYATDTLQGEVLLLSDGATQVADMLQIRYGTGEYAGIWNRQALAGTRISYEECDGICIKISESRMLQAQWRQRQPKVRWEQEEKEKTIAETMGETVGLEIAENVQEVSEQAIAETVREVSGQAIAETVREVSGQTIAEPMQEVNEQSVSEMVQESAQETSGEVTAPQVIEKTNVGKTNTAEKEFRPDRISPDKWEQLNKIYPHIHPFGDSREYLSIKPRDFIILSKKYQSLVQNSFLLHGYYNYGHVILARIKERESESFYLGVPGVYYDREKQAALMFGFEGFESGCEYASDGGFGYYMKRVEI